MRVRQMIAGFGMFAIATVGGVRLAHATSMPLDGTWIVLDQDVGTDGTFGGGPWTWTSSSPVEFDVTDLAVVGDGFAVYDNGVLVESFDSTFNWSDIGGSCTDPLDATCHWTADPNVAFADPDFNQGTLLFAPGSHSISVVSLFTPPNTVPPGGVFPDATVAFRAEVVPEPASMLLLGTGLVVLAARLRRNTRARS